MHNLFRSSTFRLILLIVGYLSLGITNTSAQARNAAQRLNELDAFAGYTYLQNDYRAPYNNSGVTLGADYTHFIKHVHGLIIPSLQVRGTIAPGVADSQRTIEIGPKIATTLGRLHPYGDFMFGMGVITFPLPPNPIPGAEYRVRDSSAVYVYGGGITYDLTRRWSALVDYQQQYWNLGEHPPDPFYPQAVTVGLLFHIPFKPYKTP
jgi:hypothetical protein